MAPQVAAVLQLLGHPTEHLADLGLEGVADRRMLPEVGRTHELLITKDVFRDEDSWNAAIDVMLDGSLMIVQLRLSAGEYIDELLGQLRALLWHWREIERTMTPGGDIRLAIISGQERAIRFRSSAQVSRWPEMRDR